MAVCTNHIWEELSIPLKRFIKNRIPKEEDADDILQEVFLRIHSNIEKIAYENKIYGWIYRITRNVIIDYYRKNGNGIDFVEIPEDLEGYSEELLPLNDEILGCLKVMIDNLQDKYKQAIILTEFQNLTQKELSEKMGLSISGAKSRVQRAKKQLKEMLLECCYFEFDHLGNIIDYRHKSKQCKFC